MPVLLQLALLFAMLSLLAIGGGAGIIPEMQRAVVDVHHWMTGPQFLALFALSRAAPGPGSLIAMLVGQQAAGFWGAVVAAVAMFAPSSILAYLAARFWLRGTAGEGWRGRVQRALAPIAVGLTLAAGIALMRGTEHGWIAWGFSAFAAAVLPISASGGASDSPSRSSARSTVRRLFACGSLMIIDVWTNSASGTSSNCAHSCSLGTAITISLSQNGVSTNPALVPSLAATASSARPCSTRLLATLEFTTVSSIERWC
jgi:chromate transporter